MYSGTSIIRMQKYIGRINLSFMLFFVVVAFLIFDSSMEDKSIYCIKFLVLAFLLLIDYALSFKDYFNKVKVVLAIKLIIFATLNIFMSFLSRHLLWENVFMLFQLVIGIEVYLCFETNDFYSIKVFLISTWLTLLVLRIINYIYFERSNNFFMCLLNDIVFLMLVYYIVKQIYLIIDKYDRKLFAKDRILEKAHEDYKGLQVAQEKLINLNEQMNNKRLELEVLNRRLQHSNNEMAIQFSITKYISNAIELKDVIKYTTESVKESMKVAFCCVIVDNDDGFNYSLDTFLPDNFKKEFYEEYLVGDRINEKLRTTRTIVVNKVNEADYPFLKKYDVASFLLCPISTTQDHGYFFVASTVNNYFNDNMYFFETLVAQINIAINHAYLYNQLTDSVNKDGLSRIFNRRYFNDFLADSVRNIEKYGSLVICIMDIDNFKSINDRYGHVFGDKIICNCACLISRISDNENIIAARYGGEEFAIVFRGVSKQDALRIVMKVHDDIKNAVTYCEEKHTDVCFNVSMGVAAYPEDSVDVEQLLIMADRALYSSKNNGKGIITYYNKEEMEIYKI